MILRRGRRLRTWDVDGIYMPAIDRSDQDMERWWYWNVMMPNVVGIFVMSSSGIVQLFLVVTQYVNVNKY